MTEARSLFFWADQLVLIDNAITTTGLLRVSETHEYLKMS